MEKLFNSTLNSIYIYGILSLIMPLLMLIFTITGLILGLDFKEGYNYGEWLYSYYVEGNLGDLVAYRIHLTFLFLTFLYTLIVNNTE